MNLKDYIGNERELIGETVLIETRFGRSLAKINRVTKKYFQVEGDDTAYFDLEYGRQKGTGDRWTHANYAKLVTEEQANDLRFRWAVARKAKEMREQIAAAVPNMDYATLVRIKAIFDEKNTDQRSTDNSVSNDATDGK